MQSFTYTARNAESMYPRIITGLCNDGTYQDSRNGPTIELQGTTVVTVMKPDERVVFSASRDCNPFFHLAEGIWMLAGRQDTAYLTQYVGTMINFSDDGKVFNAAYGHRMRKHFGFDQLANVVEALKENHDTRRAVIQLWCPQDLQKTSKDYACNMSLDLKIRNGHLNMRVNNRSNDIVWGMLGATVVHFSIIQEYIAAAVVVPMGYYTDLPKWPSIRDEFYQDDYIGMKAPKDRYSTGEVKPYRMVANPETFIADCERFCNNPKEAPVVHDNPFFMLVAHPMHIAYMIHKGGDSAAAIEYLNEYMVDCDFKVAGIEWLERRIATKTARSIDVRPEVNKSTGKLEQ